MKIIDLTKVLDKDTAIYREDEYVDPPFEMETWSTVHTQGYNVSRLAMGTQTGTHIDAPAHFLENGATLETLSVSALLGPYIYVDPNQIRRPAIDVDDQRPVILFLAAAEQPEIDLTPADFDLLLTFPCLVWVIARPVRISERDTFYFHQALAEAGKYLIEDIDEAAAKQVKPNGEIIALPLRLSGVSGSPCRVVVRQS